jgi:hypothetical protein
MYVSKYLYQVEKKHVYIKEPDFHCGYDYGYGV